ncbi:MAG: OsmC family protein [Flavobacteriales bacterium]|nr:OsmC family protein [Flavobacteriales bacterium]
MSVKIKGKYVGGLRCQLNHEPSSNTINTDAPLDNQGQGETFSPTDLVAAALGSCMLTIIAIKAKARKIEINQPKLSIEKHMNSAPRKIERVKITIEFDTVLSEENRKYLEAEAKKCPVALSLNAELTQEVIFKYA